MTLICRKAPPEKAFIREGQFGVQGHVADPYDEKEDKIGAALGMASNREPSDRRQRSPFNLLKTRPAVTV